MATRIIVEPKWYVEESGAPHNLLGYWPSTCDWPWHTLPLTLTTTSCGTDLLLAVDCDTHAVDADDNLHFSLLYRLGLELVLNKAIVISSCCEILVDEDSDWLVYGAWLPVSQLWSPASGFPDSPTYCTKQTCEMFKTKIWPRVLPNSRIRLVQNANSYNWSHGQAKCFIFVKLCMVFLYALPWRWSVFLPGTPRLSKAAPADPFYHPPLEAAISANHMRIWNTLGLTFSSRLGLAFYWLLKFSHQLLTGYSPVFHQLVTTYSPVRKKIFLHISLNRAGIWRSRVVRWCLKVTKNRIRIRFPLQNMRNSSIFPKKI